MPQSDEGIQDQVSRAWQQAEGARPPQFDRIWQAADARHLKSRQRYGRVASAAAIVAAAVVALNWQTTANETTYIELAELLESTYWSAPSDVLLPKRDIDIYQDMPVLFESFEPAGGELL
jgi:hypothetical protein